MGFLKSTEDPRSMFNPPERSATVDEKCGLIPRGSTLERWAQSYTLR